MNKKSIPQNVKFVVCIKKSESDLDYRKIYQVMDDESAAKNNYMRVVDESGEDYLYPADYFVPVKVLKKNEHSLLMTP
jgi:hypothetical protein